MGIRQLAVAAFPMARGARRRALLCGGASIMGLLAASGAAAQVVSGDPRTIVGTGANGQTVVDSHALSPDGTVAFNRFQTFKVQRDQVVDLRLPTQTLVNLVRDTVQIDGTVNAQVTGGIGGNLVFVTSQGFLLSAGGTINAGRLIVRGLPSGSGSLFDSGADFPTLSSVMAGGMVDQVRLDGTVNAPGGIDVRGRTVGVAGILNTGAAAMGALTGGQSYEYRALVSTEGLEEGGALQIRNGGIRIVAAEAATTEASATLDARPYFNRLGGLGDGGIELTTAGALSVGGTLTAWDGGYRQSGDVILSATRSATIGKSLAELSASDYFAQAKAATAIDVTGTIVAGNVTVGAAVTASSDIPFGDPAFLGVSKLSGIVKSGLLSEALGKNAADFDAFVSIVDAGTRVSIGQDSTITARGALSISAENTATGSAAAAGQAGGGATAVLVASYSSLGADAAVTVDGRLNAGSALSVTATNTVDAKTEARAVSTGTAVAGALALGEADISATIHVGGSAALNGQSITVAALNRNAEDGGIAVQANAIAARDPKDDKAKDSPGGSATAVSRMDIAANVTSAGTLTAAGDVAVKASTITDSNTVNATSLTGNGAIARLKSITQGATADTITDFLLGKVADKLAEKLNGKSDKQSSADPKARIAAAIGVAMAEQSGTVDVTGAINAGSGQVTVAGLVRDARVRNNIEAEVATQRAQSGADAVTVGGAAAWGQYDYDSRALVGGNVTANGLSVTATTDRPVGVDYSNPFRDPTNGDDSGTQNVLDWLKGDVLSKATPSLGIKAGLFGTYAGAQTSSDNDKSVLGGSFAFTRIDAGATAWVDRGAVLTIGAAGAKVASDVAVRSLSLAGPIPVTSKGIGIKGGTTAVGGALGYMQVAPVSLAGLADGVTLVRTADAAPLAVTADSAVELLTLAPLAGKGGDNALLGTFALNDVDGRTHATIGRATKLDLGSGTLTLDAETTLNLATVAGSVALSDANGGSGGTSATSIGVSGALNLAAVDTAARIGSNTDDPTIDDAMDGVATITAGAVDAAARSQGLIGAFSIAGSSIGAPATKAPGKTPATDGTASGVSRGMLGDLADADEIYALVLTPSVQKYVDELEAADKARGEISDKAKAGAGASPITKGFGAAGSSSVNIAKLATKVDIAQAAITRMAGGTGTFAEQAIDSTSIAALTGGAALNTGATPLKSSDLVAGAFGLSYSTNRADTALTGATLSGFDAVNVTGAQTGERYGLGLSLAVDTTKTDDGTIVGGSVSVLVAEDGAAARVTDSTITADEASGAVSLLAYNGLSMGAGALGFAGGSASQAGAAVTAVAIKAPDGATAALTRTGVSGYGGLSVRGLTAARIAGLAAAGAVTAGQGAEAQGGAASLSYNSIDLDAAATIDMGQQASGAITVRGDVAVQAGDLDPDPDASTGVPPTGPRFNLTADFTPSASDFDSGAGVTDAALAGGSTIYALAATGAFAGKARAAGISLAISSIDNDRTATVTGGDRALLSAGSLSVRTLDRAAILSAAAGVAASGGDRTGVGSLSINSITGASRAGILGKADNGTGLSAVLGNVTVDSTGGANIFSLAGSIAAGEQSSGGLALAVNRITRQSGATGPIGRDDAGMQASLDNVLLSDATGVTVHAADSSAIASLAVAGAVATQGNAVSSGIAINALAPVVSAAVDRLGTVGTAPSLSITADDRSSVSALSGYISAAGKVAFGAGIVVNLIDTRVAATLGTGIVRGISKTTREFRWDPDVFPLLSYDIEPFYAVDPGFLSSFDGVERDRLTITDTYGNDFWFVRPNADGWYDFARVQSGDVVTAADVRNGVFRLYDPSLQPSFIGLTAGFGTVIADTSAGLSAGSVTVAASSTATIRAASAGVAVAKGTAVAGSVVTSAIDTQVDAAVTLDPEATMTASGMAVTATRESVIDSLAGGLVLAKTGAAIGASVIVNDVAGGASARISGAGTLVVGQDAVTVRDGGQAGGGSLPQFDLLGVQGTAAQAIAPGQVTVRGLAVNAASTHATRAIAATGALSVDGAALGVTAVVENIGGTTAATTDGAYIRTDGGVDVRASTQSVSATLAGAIGAAAGGAAFAAPVISDAHSATTTARVSGAAIDASGTVAVQALAAQGATALAVAGAVGSGVAGSVAGVSPRFQATTTAGVDGLTSGRMGGGLTIGAASDARAYATFGTVAVGNAAGAAAVVVATNENTTSADYTGLLNDNGLGAVLIEAPSVAIDASGNFEAKVAGASLAAGAAGALVGNGVGIVHRGTVSAGANGLRYDRPDGDLSITARETTAFKPIVGQLALGGATGAAGSLGTIVVLSQSKVDATLERADVTARRVAVTAGGGTNVDAMQLGAAIAGVGIGANVTYIGVGDVVDTGALLGGSSEDDEDKAVAGNAGARDGRNANLGFLAGGAGETRAQDAAAAGNASLDDASATHVVAGAGSARGAFADVGTAAATAEARVRAQLGTAAPSRIAATTLSVTSDADLASRSANFQGTAGLAAGSATIAITRNAANSIAQIGSGALVSGTDVTVTASTGDGSGKAADAFVVGGTVGFQTAAIALADVKLQTMTLAESRGALNVATLGVTATDTSTAASDVYGVSGALGGALNVAVAKTHKENAVAARIGGTVAASKTADAIANGDGSASAHALAAAGGAVFAGNGAVAIAEDSRTIDASTYEGSVIDAGALTVRARATPLVDAQAYGVAVGGSLAIGASVARAGSDARVNARLGEASCFDCWSSGGTITLDARLDQVSQGDNVRAVATGSAGGGLVGLNATVAEATNDARLLAEAGSDLTPGTGALVLGTSKLTITATRQIAQAANSSGVTAAGLLSVGAQVATATATGSVEAGVANVDGGARVQADANGNTIGDPALTVAALSSDTNVANATAGAGALGAGVAAVANTVSNAAVTARIAPAAGRVLTASTLDVSASTLSDYRATADSTQASLVGGSGSTASNKVASTADVVIGAALPGAAAGQNTTIHADKITLAATNAVGSDTSRDGGHADGLGGGALTGAAALVDNDVAQHAGVTLNDGTTLRQYGDVTQNQVAVAIDAVSKTFRNHATTLDANGLILTPYAKVDSDYRVDNKVTVGGNALIRADGAVALGTTTTQALVDTAAVHIYGLAGIGGGATRTTSNVAGRIAVANGATIESLSDVRLAAGGADDIRLIDQTDVYNESVVPLSFEYDADATATLDNRLVLGDAVIRAARDVTLGASGSGVSASAVGTGHNPAVELFKLLGLSLTSTSGSSSATGSGGIAFDGTDVTAGFLARRDLTFSDVAGGGWQAVADDFDGTRRLRRTVTFDAAGNRVGDTMIDRDTGQAVGDADGLDRYFVGESSFTAQAAMAARIAQLQAQVAAAEGSFPANPYAIGDAAQRDAAIRTLQAGAARSELIAQLESAYDTLNALGPAAAGKAVSAGDIVASGGLVRINADRLSGQNVSVLAQSAPHLNITNLTSRDLVIGDAFVPFKASGPVVFGGAAQAATLTALAGAKLTQAPASDSSDGQILITANSTSGASTGVLQIGRIANVGGSYKAAIANGDYAQFGTVEAGSFAVEAPNGLFAVSAGDQAFTMGVPIDLYYGRMGVTLNDKNPLDAATAGRSIAAWLYGMYKQGGTNANGLPGGMSSGNALEQWYGNDRNPILGVAGYEGRTGVVQWADCPGTWCEIYSGDNRLQSDPWYGSEFNNAFGKYYAPPLAYVNPVRRLNNAFAAGTTYSPGGSSPTNANNTSTTPNAIRARQVEVNAKFINVSGDITAGPDKDRKLTINPTDSAGRSLGRMLAGYAVGSVVDLRTAKDFEGKPLGFVSGDSNIGVRFVIDRKDFATEDAIGHLIVDNVSAGSGGSIALTGRIINTNPLGGGSLTVLDGYAAINIDNRTGSELQLQMLNTGTDVSGTIKLRNVDASGTIVSDIYRHAPGQAVSLDHYVSRGGVLTESASSMLGDGVGTTSAITYRTDQTPVYYRYAETRTMRRDALRNTDTTHTDGISILSWTWNDARSRPQGGTFVDLANTGDAQAKELRLATTNLDGSAAPADFVQIVTGKATAAGDIGSTGYGWTRGSGTFLVPTQAEVTLVSAVKATNPIKLKFTTGTGQLNVTSRGNIAVGGTVINNGGDVSLYTEGGAIRQTEGGSISGTNVALRGDGGIGSAATPIDVLVKGAKLGQFARGGLVSALSKRGDVYLNLTSTSNGSGGLNAVYLNNVTSEKTGGLVSIASNAGLVGWIPALEVPAVTADTIRIKAGGTVAGEGVNYDPLLLPTFNVSVGAGGLSIDAGGDIRVRAVGPDERRQVLRLNEIVTPGFADIRVDGSIIAGNTTTTIDQGKLDRFTAAATALGLTPGMADEKIADITAQIRGEALAAYATIAQQGERDAGMARTVAAGDALGRLQALDALRDQGVAIDAAGNVTLAGSPATAKGGALYTLALQTLATAGGGVPALPSEADIARGLQLHVDRLAGDAAVLLGGTLPSLKDVVGDARLGFVAERITSDGLARYDAAALTQARATLTKIFGAVPTSRADVLGGAIADSYLAARSEGATWTQNQLDFQVPSTAFVPVADTRFEIRKPVIQAGSLRLIAGDSIGNFADPRSFTFTDQGLVDANGAAITDPQQKQLASAYLATSGPGDLKVTLTGTPVTAVSFTTRRDQPLPIDVKGTVDAFAATYPYDLSMMPRLEYDGSYDAYPLANKDRIRGDIFIDAANTLTIGAIVSQKPRVGDGSADCNIVSGGAVAGCDSRIRLTANAIVGAPGQWSRLPDPDINPYYGNNGPAETIAAGGIPLIMGGLVRLEAASGSIMATDGGAIQLDVRALESVRAAGDIRLARRAPLPLTALGLPGRPNLPDYAFPSDLTLGDVFAGGDLQLDNAYGSILTSALAFQLEPRNARIVAGSVSLRAAGDLGSAAATAVGLPGRLDIETPLVRVLSAGDAFGNPIPPTSSGIVATLRGTTQLGGTFGALLGAAGDIDLLGTRLTVASTLAAGGSLSLGTSDTLAIAAAVTSNADMSLSAPRSVSLRAGSTLTSGGDLVIGGLAGQATARLIDRNVAIDVAGDTRIRALATTGTINIATGGKLDLLTRSALTLGDVSAATGAIVAIGGTDAAISIRRLSVLDGLQVRATGDLALTDATIGGTLTARVDGDLTLRGNIDLSTTPGARLSLYTPGMLALTRNASIRGDGQTSSMLAGARTVAAAGSSIEGVATDLRVTGTARLGTIAGDIGNGQRVSVVAGDGLTADAVSGGFVGLVSQRGSIALNGWLGGDTIAMNAAQNVKTAGSDSNMLRIKAGGTVSLTGDTQARGAVVDGIAPLTITAGRQIGIAGALRSAGGLSLSAPRILTTGAGYLTADSGARANAWLRADVVDVRFFDEGRFDAPGWTIDLAGLSAPSATRATMLFGGIAPVIFDRLHADRAALTAYAPIEIRDLAMRDYLWLDILGGTVALRGAKRPPAADRTIVTGSLTDATVLAEPGAIDTGPSVTIGRR